MAGEREKIISLGRNEGRRRIKTSARVERRAKRIHGVKSVNKA